MYRQIKSYERVPKLASAVCGFIALSGLVGMCAIVFVIRNHASNFEHSAQTDIAGRGVDALRIGFANAIEREWESLVSVAASVDTARPQQVYDFVDAVVRASNRVEWAGVADASGRIIAGSNREDEGEDISMRRWFREGLNQPNFGNVYAPVDSHGARFVNASVPIVDDNGQTQGVMVYRLRMSWITNYLRRTARELGLDVFVMDGRGDLIVTGDFSRSGDLSDRTKSLMTMGIESHFVETLEDSRDIIAVNRQLFPDTLPRLNWRMAVRIPGNVGEASVNELANRLWVFFAALFLGLVCFAILFTRYFIAPLEDLVGTATRIANGDDSYPIERDTTRESAALSDALARIQTHLASPRKPEPGKT